MDTQTVLTSEARRLKQSVDNLAVFGGSPCFAEDLHVGRPTIGNRIHFLERVNDVLDRRWLTNNGKYVQELERRVSEFIGVRHCIAVCNGTIGLELTARALGLTGEVIVPSFTFIATAHALQWQEIVPVFADIDHRTHTLDPERVEKMITPRTTGIVGVHLWGRPCDVEALAAIARRRNLRLMFDAAHAFGCSHHGTMIGNFGDAEVFSFHATKFFNTLEGGAIVTNNDDLANKLRLMTNFGFSGLDNVTTIGTNGKMNEISAAMGLTLLEDLDSFVGNNLRNYLLYRDELEKTPGVRVISYDSSERCNYQYIVLEIDEGSAGLSRDRLLSILRSERILARRYFYPGCHRMEPYRSFFPHAGLMLPVTERLCQDVLLLPTGPSVSPEDIKTICHTVQFAVGHSHEIRERMNEPVHARETGT